MIHDTEFDINSISIYMIQDDYNVRHVIHVGHVINLTYQVRSKNSKSICNVKKYRQVSSPPPGRPESAAGLGTLRAAATAVSRQLREGSHGGIGRWAVGPAVALHRCNLEGDI